MSAFTEAALAALAAGDHPAALLALESAAASLRDPKHLLYLGNLRKETGDLSGAAEAWRAAVSVDPDHLPARMNLAAAARSTGDLPAARGLYLDVLQRNPDHRRAVSWSARARSPTAAACSPTRDSARSTTNPACAPNRGGIRPMCPALTR